MGDNTPECELNMWAAPWGGGAGAGAQPPFPSSSGGWGGEGRGQGPGPWQMETQGNADSTRPHCDLILP
jgi:hypothetical protein